MKKDKIVKSLCVAFITLGLCSCSVEHHDTDLLGIYEYDDPSEYEEIQQTSYYSEDYDDDYDEEYVSDLEYEIQETTGDVFTLLSYLKPLVSAEEYDMIKSELNFDYDY